MDFHCNDDSLEKLPNTITMSTLNSEGSLDDVNTLKQVNENLKKELEKIRTECHTLKKTNNNGTNIDEIQQELEFTKKERDNLKKELTALKTSAKTHQPVSNPLHTVLVDHLKHRNAIKTKDVEEIMRSIDRADFCPKDPYVDRPQKIGFNTTISAPHMHAIQLELLKDCLENAKKAIDIGTGSGFVALSLAKMMKGNDCKVYAIDHIPKLIDEAKRNVTKNHKEYLDNKRIEFLVADGREGLAEYAPYDIIFVGGSVRKIPDEFINQLAPGGNLIIPVGEFFQYLTVVHKKKNGEIEEEQMMEVQFGKLQSVEDQCPDIDE